MKKYSLLLLIPLVFSGLVGCKKSSKVTYKQVSEEEFKAKAQEVYSQVTYMYAEATGVVENIGSGLHAVATHQLYEISGEYIVPVDRAIDPFAIEIGTRVYETTEPLDFYFGSDGSFKTVTHTPEALPSARAPIFIGSVIYTSYYNKYAHLISVETELKKLGGIATLRDFKIDWYKTEAEVPTSYNPVVILDGFGTELEFVESKKPYSIMELKGESTFGNIKGSIKETHVNGGYLKGWENAETHDPMTDEYVISSDTILAPDLELLDFVASFTIDFDEVEDGKDCNFNIRLELSSPSDLIFDMFGQEQKFENTSSCGYGFGTTIDKSTALHDKLIVYCNNVVSISVDTSSPAYEDALFYRADFNVPTIGNFSGLNLEEVYFGDDVRVIDSRAFKNNTSLEYVYLNDGLDKIKEYAFEGCSSLRRIEIPSSVTSIETRAFTNCHDDLAVIVDFARDYDDPNHAAWFISPEGYQSEWNTDVDKVVHESPLNSDNKLYIDVSNYSGYPLWGSNDFWFIFSVPAGANLEMVTTMSNSENTLELYNAGFTKLYEFRAALVLNDTHDLEGGRTYYIHIFSETINGGETVVDVHPKA